jgi:hypothetical protein
MIVTNVTARIKPINLQKQINSNNFLIYVQSYSSELLLLLLLLFISKNIIKSAKRSPGTHEVYKMTT